MPPANTKPRRDTAEERDVSHQLATFPGGKPLHQLGRLDEARAEVELFLVANPHFTKRDTGE